MVQKKKSDEQDVLVVRDEKTGEISVVAGLSRDGTPKRVPAKAENTPDFLRFDRNSDLMDSFFRNFYRQCKEPSRFGFYRIAADQAENLLGVMKELLKDPEANKEIFSAPRLTPPIMRKRQSNRKVRRKKPHHLTMRPRRKLTQKKRMYHLNKPTKKRTTWNRNQNRPQPNSRHRPLRV